MDGKRGFMAGLTVSLAVLLLAGVGTAAAKPIYRHSIHRAMGLVPARTTNGHYDDPAVGSQAPVIYRGGSTMNTGTVTIHTVFWAPPGYRFTGSPSPGVLGYEPLVKQFFTDVAQASGSTANLFSVLTQYGEPSASGRYSIAYDAATDSIDDTAPYPSTADQCASPAGTRTCVTDGEVSHELDRVIQATDPSGRGLHDLWELFLPPDVDECVEAGECGSDYYSAYHSLADWGHGAFMYALVIDPLIEYTPINGSDPEGNPDAEAAIDSAAHETVEAMTDPEGTGWTTSGSFEIADVCETQFGAPLGYASNGSPYNQLINGHPYEIQDMWANNPIGCVQSGAATADGLPLPTVSLTQFSPRVTGNIARARGGVAVRLQLIRGGELVARASGHTRSGGSWGPLVLRDGHGSPRAVGDDRDEINVEYGAGGPPDEQIDTGAGGNPFGEAGFTGWADLDTSAFVLGNSVTVGPCFQTGVFTVTVNGHPIASPTTECNTQTDTATVPTPRLTLRSRIELSDLDNRAQTESGAGALVRLSVPLGEPGSTGSPTGLPYCTAQLRLQTVACSGLVPREHYHLRSSHGRGTRHGRANLFGVARFSGFRITGGDVLTLINSVGRVITRLHVAHLRVAIHGDLSVIASGRCQPGDYWGGPFGLSDANLNEIIAALESGSGLGFSSPICGPRGRAKGVSSRQIEQEDEQSGGFTTTSIPQLGTHIPAANAVISGGFRALAQTGFRGPDGGFVPASARVSLTITHDGRKAFHSANVERPGGVSVPGLATGDYWARWVVSDRNGDTRTVSTRFEEG